MRAKLAREWGVPGWFRMRYAYAETTPVLNLAAPSQIRGGWPEVGTTAAESTRLTHTHTTPHPHHTHIWQGSMASGHHMTAY